MLASFEQTGFSDFISQIPVTRKLKEPTALFFSRGLVGYDFAGFCS